MLFGFSVDYETDAAIQRSLRTQLGSDTTIITIAHRLQTIMDYDKIVSSPEESCYSAATLSLTHRFRWY